MRTWVDKMGAKLLGKKFGKLKVLGFAYSDGGAQYWDCKCDCGSVTQVRSGNLLAGNSTRCRVCGRTGGGHTTHGHVKGGQQTREYMTWNGFRQAVNCKTSTGYPYIGAKGIKYAKSWDSFSKFLADMGPKPDDTIFARLDTDGDYNKRNCVWMPRKEYKHRLAIYMNHCK